MVKASKLQGLSKNLIAVLLVFIFMTFFLSYYFKQEKEIENTSLRNVANLFSSQLLLIRSLWFMENKPSLMSAKLIDDVSATIAIEPNDQQVKMLTINQFGWVDSESKTDVCQQIWAMVMGSQLEFFKMPIGVVLINNNAKENGHLCRYSVKNGSYFSYNTKNGQVSVVYQ